MQDKTNEKNEKKWIRHGSRNLILLGVGASLLAIIATSISLAIYHNSGDIYLDRSRPGFLPDEVEAQAEEDEKDEDYSFPKNGKLTAEDLDEYLEKIDVEVRAIDSYDDPFGAGALSDEKLGIPKAENK